MHTLAFCTYSQHTHYTQLIFLRTYRKLQALVGNIDEHFTYNFSRTVVANARTLVRVTTTPNSVEQAGFQAVFRCFVTRLIEDYVPGTFIWNAEGDYVKTLAPLLSITEEILVKYPQKGTTYEKILQDAFCNAIRACLKRANKKFDWSNYQNAFKYKDLLEGDYRHVCDLIFRAIDKALPAAAAAAAYAGAVKGIEEYLSNDLGSYIAVVSGHEETIVVEMQKQQINVLRTIKAVQQLREDVHKAAAPRDLSVHQFTGLTILWCKKSQALLLEWVNSAVKNDRHVPANTNTHSSVAPIDVNEFVTQVIGQLNEIVIDDPFVWTQASELLVSTVLKYIKSESKNARNYLESPERDHTKKLEYVCVALSNIEKVQETLYDVIEEVEKFMESWKKAHTARRFAALSSSLSPVATTRSVVTLTASDMGSTLSSRGGGLSISAFATPVKRGITKFNNTSPLCTSEISTNRSNNDYNCDGCCDDYGGGDDDDNDKMRMEVTTATVNDAISFAIAKVKKRMTDPLTTLGSYAAQVVTPAVVAGISGAKTIEEALGEISAYYDEELSVLSDHITQRMLKRALEEYLNTLLRRVWDVSEPSYALTHTEEDSSSSGGNSMDFTKAATCDRCMQIVEGLVKYFHADGAGINKQIIAKNRLYRAISQIIDAYRLSTEELITIEKLLTAKPPAPLDDKRFEGINPVLVDYILRNRATTGDKWAIAYSREGAGSEESNVVRLQLGLPPSEFLISSNNNKQKLKIFYYVCFALEWMCFNGRNPGSLYLMSKHLGFSFVPKEEDPIVVHLKDLKSLAKVSVMIFMSGIEVKSCDGDAYTFSKFVNGSAEDIVEEITSQAILVGNTVLKSK